MTQKLPPNIALVKYHRIFADAQGGSHFDSVTVEQSLASGAPPAAPFYVSDDKPASKYRFYSFQPGWIGDWHPCPARGVPGPYVRYGGDGDNRRDGQALKPGATSSCWKIPPARGT